MLTQIVNLQQLYHVEHMEEISLKKNNHLVALSG